MIERKTFSEPEFGETVIATLIHASTEPGRIHSLSLPETTLSNRFSLIGKQLLDLHPYIGPVVRDQPVLAIDRVRYRGEPIAIVAGIDLADVALETEPMPAIATGAPHGSSPFTHVIDLLERGAHADTVSLETVRSNRLALVRTPGTANQDSAIVGRGFSLAAPLGNATEQLEATARWSSAGITIWSNSADPTSVRDEIASMTGLLPDQVEVTVTGAAPAIPGAIGLEAAAVVAARRARNPVTLRANRADFGWVGPRATIAWDATGNATLTVDAGAVAGYLPLWLDDFARLVAERTLVGSTVTADLIYSEQPPVAASKDEWLAALSEIVESGPR